MLNKYFRNISISRKLYFTIGIMASLIIVELCVLGFSLSTLSAIRGYVAGEGLWSKAQRDASLSLRVYARSGNEADYRNFVHFLQVPMGDRVERIALEKPQPDLDMARRGLLQGRNHPDDIEGMIKLLLRFHDNAYLARTIYYWKKAEASLLEFIPLSKQLHNAYRQGPLTPAQVAYYVDEIDRINAEIAPAEDGFSYTLGEGSRWLERMVLRVLILVAISVEVTGVIIAISISRGIEKGLKDMIDVAGQVGKGNFDKRIAVRSTNEIGTLALNFNRMTDRLQDSIQALQQSQIRLTSFFESSRACHIILDKNLKVSAFNKFAADFVGKHYNQPLQEGMHINNWLLPCSVTEFLIACEKALQGHMVELESQRIYPKGDAIWWQMNFEGARNANGEIAGVSYHAADITARKQQEQEVKQRNELLQQIAYIQSHELRRPLASILGLINLFKTDDYHATKEELQMLEKAAEELDGQIRSIAQKVNC